MKKDLNQPFTEQGKSTAWLLVEDETSKEFLLFHSLEQDEEEFYRLPEAEIDEREEIAMQLVKCLGAYGCSLVRFREIDRETSVSYSFVDDTPGSKREELCFHVVANSTEKSRATNDEEEAESVSLSLMLERLQAAPFVARVAETGIARLIQEQTIIE